MCFLMTIRAARVPTPLRLRDVQPDRWANLMIIGDENSSALSPGERVNLADA